MREVRMKRGLFITFRDNRRNVYLYIKILRLTLLFCTVLFYNVY